MTTLFSLIVVYLLKRYLGNYLLFKSLQQSCSSDWVYDLLFKFQLLANNFPKIPIMGASLLLVVAIGVIILLLKLFFYYASYHLGLFIFNIVLLFYCLSSAQKKNYSSMFIAYFEQTFGMMFWFTILGPLGLILFWLFSLHGQKPGDHIVKLNTNKDQMLTENSINNIYTPNKLHGLQTVNNCLYNFHSIVAWLPARIVGLVFSLIGDFKKGFSCWKESMRNSRMMHTEFLDHCGEAALCDNEDDTPELLLERAFVAWTIVCIMMSLIV